MTREQFFGPQPEPEYVDRLFCFDCLKTPKEVADFVADMVNTAVGFGYFPTKADTLDLGTMPDGTQIDNKRGGMVRIIFQKIIK